MKNQNRVSDAYRFTVDLQTREGFDDLDELKAAVKSLNKKFKDAGISYNKRVCVKPRLGYNNPNAKYYKGREGFTVKMEHGRYADVYVYDRR